MIHKIYQIGKCNYLYVDPYNWVVNGGYRLKIDSDNEATIPITNIKARFIAYVPEYYDYNEAIQAFLDGERVVITIYSCCGLICNSKMIHIKDEDEYTPIIYKGK